MRKTLLTLGFVVGLVITAPAQQAGDVVGRKMIATADARTIADNGGGTPATLSLTPVSSYVPLTCSDADGCTITLGETGIPAGMVVTIINVSANTCTFADTSGVTELAGAFSMGAYDSLTLVYGSSRWIEIARSNN